MRNTFLSILLALGLIFGTGTAALADGYRSPEQIAWEAEEKAAAMQAEAAAEIAGRAEDSAAEENEADPDDKAAGTQAELSSQSDPGDPAEANANVEAKRKSLEKKYGILIRYDVDSRGKACIGTGALAALDTALGNLTADFVRQVSNFCKAKTKQKLCYSFIYSPYQRMNLGVDVLGAFDPETSTIEIYLPAYSKDVVMGGESPLTYLHEFGHAVQAMLMEEHGEAALQREWTQLNGNNQYTFGTLPSGFDDTVWMSAYGSSRYEEDFCEVFAHAFLRVRPGQGFASRLTGEEGSATILGKKVNYIEKMLKKYLDNPDPVLENFGRVRTTAEVLNYKGYQFSGEYLQFSGCAYPRYVLGSLLNYIEVEEQSSVWITDIGGWEVVTTDGARLIVFPGGTWFAVEQSVAA